MDNRFIEESFPVREVSEASAMEKNLRHGHISTFHTWWARRPLASSRATGYAALIPAPKSAEEWIKKRDFIVDLCKGDNLLNMNLIEKAKKEIFEANGRKPPKVLDPFAGGGAIPLEALRLGCETYANDYNPVAVLIEKCILEYPQKYGMLKNVNEEWGGLSGNIKKNPLNEDVKKWSEWVLNETKKEIKEFYPSDPDGSAPVGYIWARTIPCQNPNCGAEIPLMRQYWLAKKENKKVTLVPNIKNKKVEFLIFGMDDEKIPNGFNPENGSISKAIATCLVCGSPVDDDTIRKIFQTRRSGHKMITVVLHHGDSEDTDVIANDNTNDNSLFQLSLNYSEALDKKVIGKELKAAFKSHGIILSNSVTVANIVKKNNRSLLWKLIDDDNHSKYVCYQIRRNEKGFLQVSDRGKQYRIATKEDLEIFLKTEKYLEKKRHELMNKWGIDPVPDEPIHTPDNKEYVPGGLLYNFTPVLLYGMTRWGDLFNTRQKLALITFVEKVREAHDKMLAEGLEEEYADIIGTYLAIGIDEIARFNTTINPWKNDAEAIVHIWGRQAIPMLWDYNENNPIGSHGGTWTNRIYEMMCVIDNIIKNPTMPATVSQSSATTLSYPNNYFDAIFTDPPYYDNVPYADLSDFFYVWLKRTIGHLHPDLFSTNTTPKSNEAIAELPLLRGMNKDDAVKVVVGIKTTRHFESMLNKSFQEIYRVLKPEGIAIIVYAHKSTEGWETIINALLDSGLTVTASWPIATEMAARLRARDSAALASSIYIVARKIKRKETGLYPEIKKDLHKYLNKKLERLWNEGISGADFFIAAIGAGIETFGVYDKIIDYEGKVIRADKLLEEIRSIATDFAIKQILHNGFAGEISPLTRFYVLWRWNFQEAKAPFDEARKLAQSVGINLEKEWNKGFIKKEKELIIVGGPSERTLKELEDSSEMIDILHHVLLLWEKGEKDKILKRLSQLSGSMEAFYRVAQAISGTLPNESKEKKLLDGFLSGREKLTEQIRASKTQTDISRWVK